MKEVNFRYLSQEDVIECGGLDMSSTLKDVEKGTVMVYKGDAIEASTGTIFWDTPEDKKHISVGYPAKKRINFHGAYLGGDIDIAGTKNIPSSLDNPIKRNMPRASGLITLVSSETGYPFALMDAVIISHMRTGALAGMGAKYLAPRGPYVVGLIGAGPINRTALMALKESLKQFELVKIFDLRRERAIAFRDKMTEELHLNIKVVPSAEEAVRESDVIVPATTVASLDEAYIEYDWLKRGCLLCDLSVFDEKLDVFQKADKLVVNTSLTLKRTNLIPGALIAEGSFTEDRFIDLGGIIEGDIQGRQKEDEIIVYFSRGMAVYDVINAYRVNNIAEEKGIGKTLSLWKEPFWY
ncbi:MAG: hypothetical protein ABIN18_03775 [Pseudomonadota bacterium]